MTPHCKGCIKHHNAGHPATSPLAKAYNDWCVSHGQPAYKSVGWCITHNKRVTK